ncbi:MAG TPA: tRNA 2-thiouridine(34) synthase MnmA [Gammaproteobacteria bacterium]
MTSTATAIVGLSGGVDSAVAALLLRDRGYDVQCLHMSNWEDDGYCDNAREFQDARTVAETLGLPLHRVNFADEYKEQVFEQFLSELEAGRTPNPDVLCNRQIKFGEMRRYAHRLGGRYLATGHYARIRRNDEAVQLLKGQDADKDQSYFLHAVDAGELDDVIFPLGELTKLEVRRLARESGLAVADKKDSTGICFIGERPFAEFLGEYLPEDPGPIKSLGGDTLGEHRGLAYYTIGQRQGLGIGGIANRRSEPWYVVSKDRERNALIVVQGGNHPNLFTDCLRATRAHWVNGEPAALRAGRQLRCRAKTRYRQPDQPCSVVRTGADDLEVIFETPQRAVTPGQYVVFYADDVCLGGATIESATLRGADLEAAV